MASIINATVTSPGGLVTTGDNTNELKIQTGETDAVTVNSSQVVTFNNPIVVGTNNINAENSLGFRNRIINGDMRIDQRNAGAAVTINSTGNTYTLDRWYCLGQNTDGVFTIQQDAGAVTPPVGFTDYLGATVTTADASIGATQVYRITQAIEGLNVSDLAWGTANAKTVTLSFWVRSSLTGTFGGSIANSGFTRAYPYSYTISSANTWEYKTVTISGDTTGTWLTTNGIGIYVSFVMGMGATFTGTANAWNAGLYFAPTGNTNIIATNGATFYITGVQLEVGSVATPFERRPYGTELSLCQRYYYKLQAAGASSLFCSGRNQSTTLALGGVPFPVTMRINPTALEQSGTATDYQVRHLATSTTCSDVPTLGSTSPLGYVIFTVASGLTAGQACDLRAVNSNAFLAWSAEL